MLRTPEQILAELDETLDQLMQNASVVCESDLCVLDTIELGSLQKTQESLMARFAHTQEELPNHPPKKKYEELHRKIQKMNELNAHFLQVIEKQLKPRIGRNRKRSKLREFAKSNL